jgi:hypothetical protein
MRGLGRMQRMILEARRNGCMRGVICIIGVTILVTHTVSHLRSLKAAPSNCLKTGTGMMCEPSRHS